MEALETLAVALGFASLAGVNLYLTVLITGLAVNQQWVDLSSSYPELMVLGDPIVVAVAGTLTAIEFCSDKIPWVDSAWDSIHTLIRPIGGGLLALTALGPTDPAIAVVVAMLAGGTSLMTHGMKAGTRVAINHSPEPVSNMAVSLTEDMAVIGGLSLMSLSPLVFAGVCIVFIGVSLFMAPKLFRRTKAINWLLWHKFKSVFQGNRSLEELTFPLPVEDEVAVRRFVDGEASVDWSVPVVLGNKRKFSGVTANTKGRVFSLSSDSGAIHFVGRKSWKLYYCRINLDDLHFNHESRFVSEDIVLENYSVGRRLVLRLAAGSENLAAKIVENLITSQIMKPVPSPSTRPVEIKLTELPST